jgi:putative transposase
MGLQAHPGRAPEVRHQGVDHGDPKLLTRRDLGPAPRRGGTTWRQFLTQQASSMVACDFFTVETVWLNRIYVLVFIELATRRIHLAGCTTNPNGAWVTQQARNFTFDLDRGTSTAAPVSHP